MTDAGRLRDALTLCNEALARVDDPHFAAHLTGRSPYLWLLGARAMALQLMGQLRASEADLERAVVLARRHGYLVSLGCALCVRRVEGPRCWVRRAPPRRTPRRSFAWPSKPGLA